MMIRINLLPLAQRKPTFRFELFYIVITCWLMVVFGFIYTYYAVRVFTVENEIDKMHRQLALEQPIQEKMILAEQKLQQISVKNNVLICLSTERSSWAAILSHIAGVTVPEVWFTEITGEKNLLHIKGDSLDYASIAQFIKQLDQDVFVSEPSLVNAEQDDKDPTTKFEITVKIKGL
ncbi:Tfp pilus assembly protein PilN [Sporomusaceae bacterium BoRhaA]|uniref:PilN domain-containing protein n=1 Tax=Pelorhabdus rhamnosifermentans TaxID=2772457 RepID=UPI001C064247|nr:PilN domain-containing protein [Pelorhabdus rhamnosifermentans]MBU2703041.1 Tfp pilus assembly protein PilN [Pelorhabdus rhamnosifermentans]